MSRTLEVSYLKTHRLPNPLALARYAANPALGPKVLFFSGGSALHELSQKLIRYTHNSIHLITPFDSGGSSAELRKHFKLLAVGDIRHRIMALADPGLKGNPEVYQFFATRLPKDQPQAVLVETLRQMIEGKHGLIRAVSDPMRKIIRNHLYYFYKKMPEAFDLRGASLGNLILVGGFLNNHRQIDPVIYLFSRLIEARGLVRPVAAVDLQLLADFEDGSSILGQHRFTGKESQAPASKLVKLRLANNQGEPVPQVKLKDKVGQFIEQADLICYPMGSFFSSLTANFLVSGVGDKIAANPCPKVYVPNLGLDPEQKGYEVIQLVDRLLEMLKASSRYPGWDTDYLNFLLIDRQKGHQIGKAEMEQLEARGIQVVDVELVGETPQKIEEEKLLAVLLSLV